MISIYTKYKNILYNVFKIFIIFHIIIFFISILTIVVLSICYEIVNSDMYCIFNQYVNLKYNDTIIFTIHSATLCIIMLLTNILFKLFDDIFLYINKNHVNTKILFNDSIKISRKKYNLKFTYFENIVKYITKNNNIHPLYVLYLCIIVLLISVFCNFKTVSLIVCIIIFFLLSEKMFINPLPFVVLNTFYFLNNNNLPNVSDNKYITFVYYIVLFYVYTHIVLKIENIYINILHLYNTASIFLLYLFFNHFIEVIDLFFICQIIYISFIIRSYKYAYIVESCEVSSNNDCRLIFKQPCFPTTLPNDPPQANHEEDESMTRNNGHG